MAAELSFFQEIRRIVERESWQRASRHPGRTAAPVSFGAGAEKLQHLETDLSMEAARIKESALAEAGIDSRKPL